MLSQYDSPEYAVSLLADGAAGYAYLLKDRVADSGRLARAIRDVATGGSMLDPEIVAALVSPARQDGVLTDDEEDLLRQVAEGRPVKAIATSRGDTAEAVNDRIEALFLSLARGASAGQEDALRRLRMLHAAILRTRGAGRDAFAAAAGRHRGETAHRPWCGTAHRAADGDRIDVRRAWLLRDCRAFGPG